MAGAILLTALASLLIRLYDLSFWPVFMDEDIYTWTAVQMLGRPLREAVRIAVWGATKPPMLMMVQGQLSAIVGDALLAGRGMAAVAGGATTVLCFFLGRRLGGTATGAVTSVLYAVSPLAVLHERMALQDGPMVALALGAVLLGWSAVETGSWPRALSAAALGALAVMAKVPAVVFAVLPILGLLLARRYWRSRVGQAGMAAAGFVASYAVLIYGPTGAALRSQNDVLTQSFDWRNPFGLLLSNAGSFGDAVWTYLPAGLPIVILSGLILALRRAPGLALLYTAAIAVICLPFLVFSLAANSRYFLPAVPYALALAALLLVRVAAAAWSWRRAAGGVAVAASAVVILASVGASVPLAYDFLGATLSRNDDYQYRSNWPSGYEYEAAARWLEANAAPGWGIAYVTDPRHRVAMGFLKPLPPGVRSLGMLGPTDPLPVDYSGPLLVLVDDTGESPDGQRLREVVAREPRLEAVTHFTRLRSGEGITVLRLTKSVPG